MKKKLLCLTLFSLCLCGCNEKPVPVTEEDNNNNVNNVVDDNNNNNNTNENTDSQDVTAYADRYDNETKITWTTYDNIGFKVSSFSVLKTSQDIDEYFEIPIKSPVDGAVTETKSIRSDEEFNAFKDKISKLESDGRILDSYSADYPVVDFSKYRVDLTLLYKSNCNVDFSFRLMTVYTKYNIIWQAYNGDYDDDSLVNAIAVGVSYVIFPKDSAFTISSTLVNYENHNPNMGGGYVAKKPIVYFYPEKEMDLSVKFVDEERLITTYPKYNDGWNIHLNEDGTFTNGNSDREYYALYFDEISNYKCDFKEGFYVTKDNAISFLEEKMDYIGYNNHEVDEFIMYWLPVLENNKNSIVYFEQTEERNEESPLEFSTNPDALIRTIIHIKKVDEEVSIPEQQLVHYERNGFVVTEWGGVEY